MKIQCKICNNIIEHIDTEVIGCMCGEVLLDGEMQLIACKTNTNNFTIIGNEDESMHTISSQERDKVKEFAKKELEKTKEISREVCLDSLNEYIKCLKELPPQAMTAPVTHYDLLMVLELMSMILSFDSTCSGCVNGGCEEGAAKSADEDCGTGAAACNLNN